MALAQLSVTQTGDSVGDLIDVDNSNDGSNVDVDDNNGPGQSPSDDNLNDDDDGDPDSDEVVAIETNKATDTQSEDNMKVPDDKESRSAVSLNNSKHEGEIDDSKSRSDGAEAAEESGS